VTNKATTQENISKLIEFRQAIYEHGMVVRKDVLFDLLDAMLTTGSVTSFAMLSQSEHFQRKWPSLYAGVEDGQLNHAWLRKYLGAQAPAQGVCVFPLDASAWKRPRARTLEDRQYVYQASTAVNGGTLTIGYPYSLLEWCAEPHSSWSLPLDVRRIPSTRTAQEIAVEQIQSLAETRTACCEALDIVVADGKYGNSSFLRALQGMRCGVVARLRKNRVLYHASTAVHTGKPGRPRVHGDRFAFKEPNTWSKPEEVVELEDAWFGKVRLERWQDLHEIRSRDVPYDVLRASIHLEYKRPPQALWLVWQAPPTIPTEIRLNAETLWRAYIARWPVESGIQFRKETLNWTLPRFQSKETCDRWTELIAIATWIIFLARNIVEDTPLPWQKRQRRLTPQRVQQSLRPIFALIGSPARPPKQRGKPPGWRKGRHRTPKASHPVVKKHYTNPLLA
jgi:DDE superfamily endonuclease